MATIDKLDIDLLRLPLPVPMGGRGCRCDDRLRHGHGADHGQRRRYRRGLHRGARGAGRPHRSTVRRNLPVERRGPRPGPDRDHLAGHLQAPPLCRPGRARGLRDGGGGCRALGPEGQPARHPALAAAGRRQPLGQGLCRQHRPELPGGQVAGRRDGERRAGLPVGQDAARPPDHRRGHRPRRRDAQSPARRDRDDGGRERGPGGWTRRRAP